MNKTKITRYSGFKTFTEMNEFIKSNWDNKPQPNIIGHGYRLDKYFFEVKNE